MIDGSSQLSLAACMIESPRVWEREVIDAGIDGCDREGVRRANERWAFVEVIDDCAQKW